MPGHKKTVIAHPSLHIARFSKDEMKPYIIFVHGGPGLNSRVLAYLIEKRALFDQLNYNVILYDQRGCGDSQPVEERVLHQDNIDDLDAVCKHIAEAGYELAAVAGHSYGAKVVYDYYKQYKPGIPAIFLATAPSILTPRFNNLILDLNYLKTTAPDLYEEVFKDFDGFSLEKVWQITEKLAETFRKNAARPFFYWANLAMKKVVDGIPSEEKVPMNTDVFKSVRQDLYSDSGKYSVDIPLLVKVPCLWINGFQDLVMAGSAELVQTTSVPAEEKEEKLRKLTFFQSAHYPHIEESRRFCEEVNTFLKK